MDDKRETTNDNLLTPEIKEERLATTDDLYRLNHPKTAEKYAVIKGLLQTDVTKQAIADLTGYSREHISRLSHKFKDIHILTPKRIRKAIKSVEYFTDIEKYHEDVRIKPSDVLAASKIILDRSHPVAPQSTTGATSISYTQVNHNYLANINDDVSTVSTAVKIDKV